MKVIWMSVFFFVFLFSTFLPLNSTGEFTVELVERIPFTHPSLIPPFPRSFCFIENEAVIIPNHLTGKVHLFEKKQNGMTLLKSIGPDGAEGGKFLKPTLCSTSPGTPLLSVLDGVSREIVLLKRDGKNFSLWKKRRCPNLANYIRISDDGDILYIGGYERDQNQKPYEAYAVDLRTDRFSGMVPAEDKYNLSWFDYLKHENRTARNAIGVNCFLDVSGDALILAWEGRPRVIMIHFPSGKKSAFGDLSIPRFIPPDGAALSEPYRKNEVDDYLSLKKNYSYIRAAFFSGSSIWQVYSVPDGNRGKPLLRLREFSQEGIFLGDAPIPGHASGLLAFNRENQRLYCLELESTQGKGDIRYVLRKYKIIH